MPGVEMRPLYLDWLGLASVDISPALLPRRAEAAAPVGAAKFLISSVCQQLRQPYKHLVLEQHLNNTG